MTTFSLGDVVKSRRGDAVVRAIFTTKDGELTYAVEQEGVLDFVEATKAVAPAGVGVSGLRVRSIDTALANTEPT